MALIKPRTRGKQVVPHYTRMDRENQETLYAYAAFIGEDADYVLNQVIDTVLRKDREFSKWRGQHTESFIPAPVQTRRQRRRQHGTPTAARSDGGRSGVAASV